MELLRKRRSKVLVPLAKRGRISVLDRLEHQWSRYSSSALLLLKGEQRDAALDRVKQHIAQIKAVVG